MDKSDYMALVSMHVDRWRNEASMADLVLHGVVPRVMTIVKPVPPGRRAYEWAIENTFVQNAWPSQIALREAVRLLPVGIDDREAVRWVMAATGGVLAPGDVVDALRQRHRVDKS